MSVEEATESLGRAVRLSWSDSETGSSAVIVRSESDVFATTPCDDANAKESTKASRTSNESENSSFPCSTSAPFLQKKRGKTKRGSRKKITMAPVDSKENHHDLSYSWKRIRRKTEEVWSMPLVAVLSDNDDSLKPSPRLPLLYLPEEKTPPMDRERHVLHLPDEMIEPEIEEETFSMPQWRPLVRKEDRAEESPPLSLLPRLQLDPKTNDVWRREETVIWSSKLPLLFLDLEDPSILSPPVSQIPLFPSDEDSSKRVSGLGVHSRIHRRRIAKNKILPRNRFKFRMSKGQPSQIEKKEKSVQVDDSSSTESSDSLSVNETERNRSLQEDKDEGSMEPLVREQSPDIADLPAKLDRLETEIRLRREEERRAEPLVVVPVDSSRQRWKNRSAAEIDLHPILLTRPQVTTTSVQTDAISPIETRFSPPSPPFVTDTAVMKDDVDKENDQESEVEAIPKDDVEKEDEENDEESEVETIPDVGDRSSSGPVRVDLTQVVASRLFFEEDPGRSSFLSVVDISASQLDDLPTENEGPIEREERECEVQVHETSSPSDDSLTRRLLSTGEEENLGTATPENVETAALDMSLPPVKDAALKSRLVSMMEQLNAIEATAKRIDMEFQDSKLLLHTIDRLQSVEEIAEPLPEVPQIQREIEKEPGNNEEKDQEAEEEEASITKDSEDTDSESHYQPEIDQPEIPSKIASPVPSEKIEEESSGEASPEPSEKIDLPIPTERIASPPPVIKPVPSIKSPLRAPRTRYRERLQFKPKLLASKAPPRPKPSIVFEEECPPEPTASQIKAVFAESESSKKPARNREELLRWMRKKHEERQVEYLQKTTQLRRAEAHPFKPRTTHRATARSAKEKEEQLKEHLAERVQDAFNLMSSLVTSKESTPRPHRTSDEPMPLPRDGETGNISVSSSGSVMSNIDWDEIDRILDS